jgi:hypothetical protein
MPPDEDDLRAEYGKLQHAQAAVSELRGEFLARMIDIEDAVDRIILYFFAPDEPEVFVEHVLGTITFERRLAILQRVLRFLGKYDEFKKEWKALDALRVERNKFAHAGFDFLESSYNDPGGNYRMVLKRRVSYAPPRDDDPTFDMVGVRSLIYRATQAYGRWMFEIGPTLVEAHEPPAAYFFREGWDPRGRFE